MFVQVDLAEYAPNLRGSGVHGALVMLEPKFNAELLASILSIPGSKTLLRRHLSIHFASLVGRQVVCAAVLWNSMGSLDPYPDSQSESRRAKMTDKQRKKLISIFEVLDVLF